MAKTADIIRQDMFGLHTGFDGSIPRDCQEDAATKFLVALVSIIMDIKKIDSDDVRRAILVQFGVVAFPR